MIQNKWEDLKFWWSLFDIMVVGEWWRLGCLWKDLYLEILVLISCEESVWSRQNLPQSIVLKLSKRTSRWSEVSILGSTMVLYTKLHFWNDIVYKISEPNGFSYVLDNFLFHWSSHPPLSYGSIHKLFDHSIDIWSHYLPWSWFEKTLQNHKQITFPLILLLWRFKGLKWTLLKLFSPLKLESTTNKDLRCYFTVVECKTKAGTNQWTRNAKNGERYTRFYYRGRVSPGSLSKIH